MAESVDRPADIFISYSRHDRSVVDELTRSLDEAGHRSWIDVGALRGGDQWRAEIARAIKSCRVVVLVCSQASFSSRYVHDELAVADAADPRPRILPVFIESVTIPDELELMIRSRQWIDLSHIPRGEWGARLVEELDGSRSLSPSGRVGDRKRRGITRRALLIGAAGVTAGAVGLALRSRDDSSDRLSVDGAEPSGTAATAATAGEPDVGISPAPTALWEKELLGDSPTSVGISVDSVSFQDSMRSVVCLRAETGDEAYRLDLPDTGGYSGILAEGGFVYVLHDFDGITALNEENFLDPDRGGLMAKALDIPLDVIFGGASVTEGLLVVSTLDPPYGSGIYGDLDLATAPQDVRAYDRLTGEVAWESGPVGVGLMTHDQGVFSVDDTGTLRAFEAATGDPRWSASLAGRGTVVAAGDRQPIVALAGDEVVAFNPLDGSEVWRTDVPQSVGHAAQDGVVYVASERRVWAAAADTGQTAWDQKFDGTLGVLLDGGTLYLLRNREIVAVDPATGAQGWTLALDGDLFVANAARGTLATVTFGPSPRVVAYGQHSA